MSPFSPKFLQNYSLVVSDFDGTLVDKSLKLSVESEKFIRHILKNNLHFSIASGRPFFGIIEQACEKLDLHDYQIAAGGSIIVDPKSKKPIWIKHFEPDLVKEIVANLLGLNANFAVETFENVYTEDAIDKPQYGPAIAFKNLNDVDYSVVNKIVVIPAGTSSKAMEKVHDFVEENNDKLHAINANSPAGPAYDLTPPAASKHFAVLELINLMSIEPEKTIGIGDGYNDYPLLSACKYKVAIEGAPKELVEIADLVIKRNDLYQLANES